MLVSGFCCKSYCQSRFKCSNDRVTEVQDEDEVRNFAAEAYWFIQATRQKVFDESRLRELYSIPPAPPSSQTSGGVFTSNEEEHRRKCQVVGSSTLQQYYVSSQVDSHVQEEKKNIRTLTVRRCI